MDKAAWRAWAREVRASTPDVSEAVTSHLRAWLRERGVSRVLAYRALPGEVSVAGLEGDVTLFTTRTVWIPQRRLTLHDWAAATVVSRAGILEPPRGTPEVERGAVEVVLVPGLAFDRRGGRLGYGGGFYDRLLAGWDVPRVAVTSRPLVVEELPLEAHDARVDFLATEDGVVPVRGG